MPISSQCPSCFKAIQLPDGSYGKKVRCGACKHVFVIDEPPIEEPAAAVEPPVVIAPAPPEPVTVVADEVAGVTEKAGTLPKKPPKAPPPLKRLTPPKAQSDRDDSENLPRKKKKESGSGAMIWISVAVLLLGFFTFSWITRASGRAP